MNTKEWFIDRIGKKVFRNSNGCNCDTCKRITNDGLVIFDGQHASYLHEMEGMSHEPNSKHPFIYSDKIISFDKES